MEYGVFKEQGTENLRQFKFRQFTRLMSNADSNDKNEILLCLIKLKADPFVIIVSGMFKQ